MKKLPEDFLETQRLSALENETLKGGSAPDPVGSTKKKRKQDQEDEDVLTPL